MTEMNNIEQEHKEALVVLSLTYPFVEETASPELFLFKEKEQYHVGIVDITGHIIVESVVDKDTEIDVFYYNGINIIQLKDNITNTIRIYTLEDKILKCIYRSKRFKVDRLLQHVIIMYDIQSNAHTIINYNGAKLTDREYLNIVEYLPSHDIIGVHYLEIDKENRSTIRKYDAFNKHGKLRNKDMTTTDIMCKYLVDNIVLYSRGLNHVRVRKLKDRIEIRGDNLYFRIVRRKST